MDYANREERRQAVRGALGGGRYLSTAKRKDLAKQFNCHPSAIWADCLVLVNGSINNVRAGIKKKILQRDGNICYMCGQPTDQPIIEHKIPARAGGKPTEDNLAVACQSCNMKKRFKDLELYPLE